MAKPAVVIIGAGHNGLITAFYLAKAGYKPIVLERRETVGGAAITEEFHPGFKCSTLAHAMGPLAPELMRAMKLKRHGLEWIRAEPAVTALHPDGRCLPLYADTTRSAEAIAKFSEKDARRYPEFQRTLHQVAGVLARTLTMTPPEIDSPSTGDIFKLLGTGRAFRKLGLEFIPSSANFVLVQVGDGQAVFNAMQKLGIIVRSMASYQLPEWIRISIGAPRQNKKCLGALQQALGKSSAQ